MHKGVGFSVSATTRSKESFVNVIQLNGFRGSADALRQLKPQINSDCIVVTGNVPLCMDLYSIANVYRCKECAYLVVLGKDEKHVADKNKVCVAALTDAQANPIYGITDDMRILSYGDLLARNKDFKLPCALIRELLLVDRLRRRYPSFKLYSNLFDTGVYFLNRLSLDYLDLVPKADDLKVSAVRLLEM